MGDSGRAWLAGQDPRSLARSLNRAHDRFVDTGQVTRDIRPLVAKSWARSVGRGLDPEGARAPLELAEDELRDWRARHPLAVAMPVVRKLLVDHAAEAGMLVAVSDHLGRLLWVEGESRMRERALDINFTEGASWSEARVGTNAPGTALALDQAVQIFGAEHLSRTVTPWSCTAVPVHDPDTGAVLGCLDVTGGDEVAAPHALWLVRAAVTAVEGELRLQRLQGASLATRRGAAAPGSSGSSGSSGSARRTREAEVDLSAWSLDLLGRPRAVLRRPDDAGGDQSLSLRHSELLALLALHPEGQTGDQLSLALYERDSAGVSLRAELSRLRPVLEPARLLSRPYRLPGALAGDVIEVRALLAAGELGRAVERYSGPVLPASTAPGVVRLREAVHEEVRTALLEAGDADALLRFAAAEHGALDWDVWNAGLAALPAGSARRPHVARQVALLDRELG